MDVETIILKLQDGDAINVSKQRLTEDSRMFRYLIEELHQRELEFDDFTPEAVTLFVTLLDDKDLGRVENVQFRELNKLAVVHEVVWMTRDCKEWLRNNMESAKTYKDKYFVFEECVYMIKRWNDKEMMDGLLSRVCQEDNSSFVSQYMVDLDTLDKVQIDSIMKIGGSNTKPFLRIILINLKEKRKIGHNAKYLLDNLNLALCFEHIKDIYLEICGEIHNLPDISMEDMKSFLQLVTETTRSVKYGSEERKTRTVDLNHILYASIRNITDIVVRVQDKKIISMFVVVDVLLSWFYKRETLPGTEEIQLFITSLERSSCKDKQFQKVSRSYLQTITNGLKYSPLPQKVQLISVLNEINNSYNLSTYHENMLIKRDTRRNDSPVTLGSLRNTVINRLTSDKQYPIGTVFKDYYICIFSDTLTQDPVQSQVDVGLSYIKSGQTRVTG